MGLMYGDPAMNTEIFAALNYEEDGVVYENANFIFIRFKTQTIRSAKSAFLKKIKMD